MLYHTTHAYTAQATSITQCPPATIHKRNNQPPPPCLPAIPAMTTTTAYPNTLILHYQQQPVSVQLAPGSLTQQVNQLTVTSAGNEATP